MYWFIVMDKVCNAVQWIQPLWSVVVMHWYWIQCCCDYITYTPSAIQGNNVHGTKFYMHTTLYDTWQLLRSDLTVNTSNTWKVQVDVLHVESGVTSNLEIKCNPTCACLFAYVYVWVCLCVFLFILVSIIKIDKPERHQPKLLTQRTNEAEQ